MDVSKVDHDIIHGIIGISTEAGELLDQLKKHMFYGKPFDLQNFREEIGDLCWYMAIATKAIDVDLQDIMESNIRKLKARYGEKFSTDRAINRNHTNEMNAMDLV
jgi:NTP pyrophosphatase (non-canonical NTP hydrolase)